MLKKLLFITFISSFMLGAKMKLISPAFSENEAIPKQYTCDGTNISPALAWSEAPEGTQSFALIVEDPDSPSKTWTHWIIFNIPITVEYLIENQGAEGQEVPFLQGLTDFNAQKWSGPCPPQGTHHYHFTLYALDTMLDLPAGATKKELLSAMHGHILEKTTLIGTYQRK
jgi:Raf kinase inhibitor-like YbhB/YbcL family protein